MKRRAFIKSGTLAGLATTVTAGNALGAKESSKQGKMFKMKYAPHLGQFKTLAGGDPIDELKFMADQGFTALEDNGMMKREVSLQNAIAKTMVELGMEMGVFVANAQWGEKTFVHKENRDALVKKMKEAVEVAKRVNAKWTTVVPDSYDPGLEWDYQTANVIDNLKACAEVCEPSGLIMVLEPLNPWANHPGLFLSKIPQAYQICKAVNSPSCKILDDLYHQQVTEGNLIANLEMAWEEIAYFQVGDNPGRNEPGTGEINYSNIFKHLHDKGYTGIVGMEHGTKAARDLGKLKKAGTTVSTSQWKAAEQSLIDAYRKVDQFVI